MLFDSILLAIYFKIEIKLTTFLIFKNEWYKNLPQNLPQQYK